MIDATSLRMLLLATLLGAPILAIVASRLGVVPALLAVSSYLLALAFSAIATEPGSAIAVAKDLIVATTAGSATVVAWKGLQTWKFQSIADRKADFLDELIDGAQQFVQSMAGPKQAVNFCKIGLASYSEVASLTREDRPGPEIEWPAELSYTFHGASAYIEKNGAEDSKRLWALLEEPSRHAAHIRALVNKGQVLDLEEYDSCHSACMLLTWQHDRVQAFASTIGSVNANFEHPQIQSNLIKVLALDESDLEIYLQDQLTQLLAFARSSYSRIYE